MYLLAQEFGAAQLSSITGIIILSTLLMEFAKRYFGSKAWLQHIPTFIYVTSISIALTCLSHYVLHWLEGNIKDLLWNATYSALASSGFYTWLRQPIQTIGQAEQARLSRKPKSKKHKKIPPQ